VQSPLALQYVLFVDGSMHALGGEPPVGHATCAGVEPLAGGQPHLLLLQVAPEICVQSPPPVE
jgi:hypothetical protein